MSQLTTDIDTTLLGYKWPPLNKLDRPHDQYEYMEDTLLHMDLRELMREVIDFAC